ncbi:MAG: hypothetical protein GC161_12055 [Planctomycetaceae bacterium]|nr:hypothetical protein [Planctomycetaceae bacterium]
MKNPQLPVSLRAVVEEMDVLSDEMTAYVNRHTGELVTLTGDDVRAVEDGVDEEFDDDEFDDDELLDGETDESTKVREVLASEDFLPLPSKFDIDEYRIMERFCEQVEDSGLRDDLLRAIRGSGAFGRLKALAQHRGLMDAWYTFRDRALEDIAAEWLDANGIPYTRDNPPKAVRWT